jgi:hypothetical protein
MKLGKYHRVRDLLFEDKIASELLPQGARNVERLGDRGLAAEYHGMNSKLRGQRHGVGVGKGRCAEYHGTRLVEQ